MVMENKRNRVPVPRADVEEMLSDKTDNYTYNFEHPVEVGDTVWFVSAIPAAHRVYLEPEDPLQALRVRVHVSKVEPLPQGPDGRYPATISWDKLTRA
jgi:hypothetical protein